jgi:hypothetical protein
MSVPPRVSVESTVVVVLASRIDGPVRSPMVTSWPVVGSVATTVAAPAVPTVAADGSETAGAAADGVEASEPIAFATSNGVTKPTLEVVPTMDSFNAPAKPVSKSALPVTAY